MTTSIKTSDLRAKTPEELQSMLDEQQLAQFRLRMMKATNQLGKPHEVRQTRRMIARLKTLQTQQAKAGGHD